MVGWFPPWPLPGDNHGAGLVTVSNIHWWCDDAIPGAIHQLVAATNHFMWGSKVRWRSTKTCWGHILLTFFDKHPRLLHTTSACWLRFLISMGQIPSYSFTCIKPHGGFWIRGYKAKNKGQWNGWSMHLRRSTVVNDRLAIANDSWKWLVIVNSRHLIRHNDSTLVSKNKSVVIDSVWQEKYATHAATEYIRDRRVKIAVKLAPLSVVAAASICLCEHESQESKGQQKTWTWI